MLPIDCNSHPDSRNNPILKRYILETLKYGRREGKNSSFLVGRQWNASGVLCSDSPWCYSGTYILCSFIDPFNFSVHRIQIYLAFFFFWKYNANILVLVNTQGKLPIWSSWNKNSKLETLIAKHFSVTTCISWWLMHGSNIMERLFWKIQ